MLDRFSYQAFKNLAAGIGSSRQFRLNTCFGSGQRHFRGHFVNAVSVMGICPSSVAPKIYCNPTSEHQVKFSFEVREALQPSRGNFVSGSIKAYRINSSPHLTKRLVIGVIDVGRWINNYAEQMLGLSQIFIGTLNIAAHHLKPSNCIRTKLTVPLISVQKGAPHEFR